jgi:glycosyltransferase involved in cell wall biosynthesis
MRIGLVSSAVPLIQGGGRFIVDWLRQKLEEHGHSVAVVYIPSTDEPDTVLQQMVAFRMIKLDDYFDTIITFRPPSHVVSHPNKVIWFIHHIRVFYDLWDSPYRPVPDLAPWRALRATIMRADTMALCEARRVFTNSHVVGERLRRFNGVASEVLYPPLLNADLFRSEEFGDEIVCISRIEPHKRQHLLVEAMRHVRTPVRLRLCGLGTNSDYISELTLLRTLDGLDQRVTLEIRWISETEKVDRLATALAIAYVPVDEDSYGYPTIEAAYAMRCTVTLADSGGTLEFVQDGINGRVVTPDPRAIAEAFDALYADRRAARRMGQAARERVNALGISWDSVIARLLS